MKEARTTAMLTEKIDRLFVSGESSKLDRLLVAAAASGACSAVSELLRRGASADFCDERSRTALVAAAANGHVNVCIDLLLALPHSNYRIQDVNRASAVAESAGHTELACFLREFSMIQAESEVGTGGGTSVNFNKDTPANGKSTILDILTRAISTLAIIEGRYLSSLDGRNVSDFRSSVASCRHLIERALDHPRSSNGVFVEVGFPHIDATRASIGRCLEVIEHSLKLVTDALIADVKATNDFYSGSSRDEIVAKFSSSSYFGLLNGVFDELRDAKLFLTMCTDKA